MEKNILLIGTGAQAKYALEIFHLKRRNVLGLIALPEETPPERIDGVDVLGGLEDFEKIYVNSDQPALLCCCSKNKLKEQLETKLSIYAPRYVNAIHPTAVIARTATLGHGVIINANAVIQPYTRIGNHVMIHAGVIIEHDCVIKDFVNLAPRAALAGYVRIGKGSTIYTGAAIIPNVEVGEYSIVGAGAVVLKNIENHRIVAGIPARGIKVRSK